MHMQHTPPSVVAAKHEHASGRAGTRTTATLAPHTKAAEPVGCVCAEGPAGSVAALTSQQCVRPAVRATPALDEGCRAGRATLSWTGLGRSPAPRALHRHGHQESPRVRELFRSANCFNNSLLRCRGFNYN